MYISVCRTMNQWQEETVPVRFLSPAPPQTTLPALVCLAPVPRAARAWNAVGAQRRASRLGLLSLLDRTVVEEEEEQEKLKKRPKTEWQRCRGVPVSYERGASAPCRLFAATAGVQERETEETQRWTRGGETVEGGLIVRWDYCSFVLNKPAAGVTFAGVSR